MADPVSIEAAQQASTVAVSLNLISKSFGATLALDNVSFDIQAGSVHALLGENGAGKSTLVKLLSGLIEPDRGTIQLLGQSVRLPQPRRAHRYGIQTAFQEMTLVGDLTVLENMLLAYAPVNALGLIDRRGGERAVSAHFTELGMADI
ncbi:MAG: sugar ABC transporter ATP-binding protein, partial [Candidatus Competibacteraceae bacterium]|nr:sugar ABC transporter ATP-binding protein [Candidatus Competibacteraceae bacterium]